MGKDMWNMDLGRFLQDLRTWLFVKLLQISLIINLLNLVCFVKVSNLLALHKSLFHKSCGTLSKLQK